MKRFISVLCAAAIVFSTVNICGTTAYAAEDIFEFSDDFSYYPSNTVIGTDTGDKAILSGTNGGGGFWKESSKNEKYGTGGKAYITENGELFMSSSGQYMNNVLNLAEDHSAIGAAQYARVDVYTRTNPARGIRIMVDSSEKSYYSLGFTSWTNTTYGMHYPVFLKVENSATKYIKVDDTQGEWKSTWCTLEIYVCGTEIGYKITDKSNPSRVFSGVMFDDNPYALSGNDAGVQLYVTTDDNAYFDNFVYKTAVPYLNIGEPSYKLYRELNDAAAEDGTVSFSDCVPVRRISAPELAGESIELSLSEDGNVWETVTAAFDSEGNFLNTVTGASFAYAKAEDGKAEKMTFLGEYDGKDEIIIPKGGKYKVYSTFGGVFENPDAEWSSDSDDILSVQNGDISALHVGKAHITVADSGAELGFDVNVLGEIGFAKLNNTESEYILSKKETIDELNRLITAKNETGFLDMFRGTSDKKLSDIADLNVEEITLSDDEVKKLGKRLFTYGSVRFNSLADAEKFIALFNQELRVGELCGVTDAAKFEQAVIDNADIIGFDAEEEYYKRYKEQIIADMLGSDFANASDAGDMLHRGTIYHAVKNSIAFAEIGDLVSANQKYLRYDKAHFDKLSDKKKLYRSILNNLENIDSAESLAAYIDAYKEQKESKPSGNGGGGGGSGGGRVVSVPQTNNVISPTQSRGNIVKSNERIFADVPAESWAYEGTKYLYATGAISGDENLLFRPEEPITRAEFIKILLIAQKAELASEGTESSFADVNGDEWYAAYINTAYGMGILNGDSENNAMPEKEITRQEIAAIVFRMTQKSGRELLQTAEFTEFRDDGEIAPWALEAVRKLQLSAVLNGDENGCFNPMSNATRAEGAQIVYKLTKTSEYKTETAEQQ